MPAERSTSGSTDSGSNLRQEKGRIACCRHRTHSLSESKVQICPFFVNQILLLRSFNPFPYISNYEVSTVSKLQYISDSTN